MKVLVIIPQEKFNNKEYNTVVSGLKLHNIDFDLASTSKIKATGYIAKEFNDNPMEVFPDLAIEDIDIKNYNCLIIIGGSGNKKYLWNNDKLLGKIQKAYSCNILVAAICLAPICLINAGIIKSSNITAYKTKETQKIIEESGNIYMDKEVYINKNIITANGPGASKEFIETIVSKLGVSR